MKRELSICIDTMITLIYDDEYTDSNDAISIATNLAYNPSFNTIEDNVKLKRVYLSMPRISYADEKLHRINESRLSSKNLKPKK